MLSIKFHAHDSWQLNDKTLTLSTGNTSPVCSTCLAFELKSRVPAVRLSWRIEVPQHSNGTWMGAPATDPDFLWTFNRNRRDKITGSVHWQLRNVAGSVHLLWFISNNHLILIHNNSYIMIDFQHHLLSFIYDHNRLGLKKSPFFPVIDFLAALNMSETESNLDLGCWEFQNDPQKWMGKRVKQCKTVSFHKFGGVLDSILDNIIPRKLWSFSLEKWMDPKTWRFFFDVPISSPENPWCFPRIRRALFCPVLPGVCRPRDFPGNYFASSDPPPWHIILT